MNVSEIGKVQALVLVQDVGLWSGNRRKMEIAECRKTLQRLWMCRVCWLTRTDLLIPISVSCTAVSK